MRCGRDARATRHRRFAHARNVSQIIVGRAHPQSRLYALHQSVTTDLLARNENFDVMVVAGEDERPAHSLDTRAPSPAFDWPGYRFRTGAD